MERLLNVRYCSRREVYKLPLVSTVPTLRMGVNQSRFYRANHEDYSRETTANHNYLDCLHGPGKNDSGILFRNMTALKHKCLTLKISKGYNFHIKFAQSRGENVQKGVFFLLQQ